MMWRESKLKRGEDRGGETGQGATAVTQARDEGCPSRVVVAEEVTVGWVLDIAFWSRQDGMTIQL